MKNWGLIAVGILSVGIGNAQAIRRGVDLGNGIDQGYDYAYSTAHQKTITGFIAGKVKGHPENGMAGSMTIIVRTKHGKQYQVDVGPNWYVGAQTARLNVGDKVKVLGSVIVIKSSHSDKEDIMLPRQIMRGKQVLVLRDGAGVPYWIAMRKGRYNIPGASNSITGKLMSQNEVTVGNEKQIGYQVQTQNGLVNVAVAPNWYLEQQGLGFHVGDNITVYTGAGPSQFGSHILLADGLYGSEGTFVLRPNGVPVWNGWSNGN
jgi:hypothetical protein